MTAVSPLISVLVPTYNRAALLGQTLHSVLAQQYQNLEVIVGDNASTDGTSAVIEQYKDLRLTYIRHPKNLGMVGNWDALVARARGEYFLLLSDDDLLEPDTLQGLVSAIQAVPQAAFAFCSVAFVDVSGRSLGFRAAPSGRLGGMDTVAGFLMGGLSVYLCGTLYRRAEFMSLTRFSDSACRMSVDAAAWMKSALHSHAVAGAPGVTSIYRVHDSSETGTAGIASWQEDLMVLSGEIAEAARTDGQTPDQVAHLIKLFNQHIARTTESLILNLPRNHTRQMGAALALLWRYHSTLTPFLGPIRLVSSFLRLLLPTALDVWLQRIKGRFAAAHVKVTQ